MKMKKITTAPKYEGAVLRAIEVLTKRLGYPPTLKELGEQLGKTSSRVHQMIEVLSARGVVEHGTTHRTIRVVR